MLTKFISGNESKKIYFIFIILFWVWWGILSYLASLRFPVPYSMLNNHISNLGGIVHNPDGHLLWNIGMIISGVISIPYYGYLYQYFKPQWPNLSKWMLGIGFGCALGFSFIGVFPEDIEGFHQLAAVFNMVGIPALAACIQYIVNHKPELVRSSKGITFINILLWIFFAAMILIFRLDELLGLSYPPEPRIFDFSLWEWCYFLMTIAWMIILISLLKSDKKDKKS